MTDDPESSDGGRRPAVVALVAGVATFAAGVLAVVSPEWAPEVGPGAVAVVGAGTVLLAGRALYGIDRARPFQTPDVETLPRVPVPGATLDPTLAEFLDGETTLLYSRRVRRALSNAAVAVCSRYRGLAPETARERVTVGEWTDDAVAAALLAGDGGPDAPRPGVLARLRRRESQFDRGVRHAVAAVAGVAGVDVESPDSLVPLGSGPEDGAGRGPAGPPADGERERSTGRWVGLTGVALALAGVGVVGGWPGVVLAGTVPLGYAAYARLAPTPRAELRAERTVSTARPAPGDRVAVTLTLRNAGERTLPDVRVVDGVPGGLGVVEGAARTGVPLGPGDAVRLEYAVEARRGRHEFDPPLAVVRGVAGTRERVVRVPVAERESSDPGSSAASDGDGAPTGESFAGDGTALTCLASLTAAETVPPLPGSTRYAGEIATDDGGHGVEFHSTREYRRGDPLTRVDWNRLARHGELASREYRRERATTAVVVVDARPAAYLAPAPGPHAVDRAVEAARAAFAALDGGGNRVGVAVVGRTDGLVAPGSGADHRARVRSFLATHPALASVPPDPAASDAEGRTDAGRELAAAGSDPRDDPDPHLRYLRGRIPTGASVVLCSPVADEGAVRIARGLAARGHPVTALSPDPTAARTPTTLLARVARVLRLARLRDAGVRVVDWPGSTVLAVALARARREG